MRSGAASAPPGRSTLAMLHDWGVIAAAFGYIGFLFLVASHGDRRRPAGRGRASGLIYPLSLAIYCTSWTFFGSVASPPAPPPTSSRSMSARS